MVESEDNESESRKPMSLKPNGIPPVPEITKAVAIAAFPKGNLYIQMRDELGSIYTDDMFIELYSNEGQPGWSAWRLALITVMQFAENLSDRQAADAVRARLDWKYALSLELTDSGFHYSILSEFRARLVRHEKSQLLLDEILKIFKEKGWIKTRGQQRTDSTHMLATVRELDQLEVVGETLRYTLNVLATVAPDWLRMRLKPEWGERYGERVDEYRLPKEKQDRQELLKTIGQDGQELLEAIEAEHEQAWLKEVEAVKILHQVWEQQYIIEGGQIRHRELKEMPPVGEWIRSPFDPEARYGRKRDIHWVGYKVHLTETCDDEKPHLITQVETRPAIEQDNDATADIQQELVRNQITPSQHLVDAGYMSAKLIFDSQENHKIDLIGPVHVDPSWQSRTPGAFDASQFQVDWQTQSATCPQGQKSKGWYLQKDSQGEPVIQINFDRKICFACADRFRCSKAKSTGRSLVLRAEGRHQILQAARERQQTDGFKRLYRKRSGIEGTLSQGIRSNGLRRSRYVGQAKTHLQNLSIAVAMNLKRLSDWLNEVPLASTRHSRFTMLLAST
jgi:transposase